MGSRFRVFRSLEEVPPDFGPSALSVGNFDGVHAGHRLILRRVTEIAAEQGLKPSVLTFDPHPAKIVAPERAPRLMTDPQQRCALMRAEGIEQVLVLPFNPEVARLTPQQFVEEVVVKRLGARAVLIGENFRFGHAQAGNARLLEEMGKRLGFAVEAMPALAWRGTRISSSVLRQRVDAGQVARAARLLTRPYALEGHVTPGHGVGARKTVPTLNLATACEVLPKVGVYVTRTTDLDAHWSWESVSNVGYRPTFGGDRLSVESFLLEPLAGEPPRRLRVEFLWRLRDERKFESAEALKAQIMCDARRAQAYFRRVKKWTRQPVCYYS